MKYTTLNKIKEHGPCRDGWSKLLKYLGKKDTDDKRLYFKTILKSNGIEDAVWALRTLAYKDYCLFLADVAESVLHIFEHKCPDDDRPRKAIRAVRDYHGGKIDKSELFDAASAAYAAYAASSAAYASSANDAAYTAYAAASAYAALVSAYAYTALVSAANANANAANANAAKNWKEIETLFIKHFC